MKNIGLTTFVARQLCVGQDSPMGGLTKGGSTLLRILGSYPEDEAKTGFAPFVRVVEIHPEDLHYFLGTFREAHDGEVIMTRLESRRKGELAVPVSYLIGEKEAPTAARVILYSREQLEKEGETAGMSEWAEWGVVSINCGPVDEPMQPATMWRNYWASRNPDDPRGFGGSPHWKEKTDADFIKELARSEAYWANRGRCVLALPPLTEA